MQSQAPFPLWCIAGTSQIQKKVSANNGFWGGAKYKDENFSFVYQFPFVPSIFVIELETRTETKRYQRVGRDFSHFQMYTHLNYFCNGWQKWSSTHTKKPK